MKFARQLLYQVATTEFRKIIFNNFEDKAFVLAGLPLHYAFTLNVLSKKAKYTKE
jgi:hypothetical protein